MLRLGREKQWMMIGAGYVIVTLASAGMIYGRHLQMAQDPVTASSGMAAAGDALLAMFVSFLYLLPTVFLLRLLAERTQIYDVYSRVLLAVSVTAPLALVVLIADSKLNAHLLADTSTLRLFGSPLILAVIVVSRWMARSALSKRLTEYATLLELIPVISIVGFFFLAAVR